MNADKTKFICLKQEGTISTLSGKSLKLVGPFAYVGNNISSTESDVNQFISKTWTTINKLLIIRKTDPLW